MFKNIGGKIKGLAKAFFILGAIVPIIVGIVLMSSDENMVLVGILVMVGGFVVAWISSWFLYGFGELIDKTCAIERNTRGYKRLIDAQSKVDSEGITESQSKEDSERIKKIEHLRSQGLITEEEYIQAISKKQ